MHKWIPEKPKAILFILHGIFEHGGRYRHVAKYLNDDHIGVVAADHYGHGRSPGKKGYIDSWDHLVTDTDHWIESIKAQYPGIPFFLLGHSLGGLLAVSYLMKRSPVFKGVILLSAALRVKEDLSPLLQKLAPLLAAVAPGLKTIKLDATAVSRDPVVVSNYLNDPDVYTGKVYAKTGNETLRTTKEIRKTFSKFEWPVLVLHGTADRLTEPQGSQDFYDQIISKDKTIKFYDGWYHELVNEPGNEQVLEGIRVWISSRC